MNDNFSMIEYLQKESQRHYIDVIPLKAMEEEYPKLERYLLETYLIDFAKKISIIIIKLIYYYNAKIYLMEFKEKSKYEGLLGQDLRTEPLKELEKIITYVIIQNNVSMKILLEDEPNSLISINGHFSVDIFNASKDLIKLLEMLTQQEKLFLKS